jgi:hypothetical protein
MGRRNYQTVDEGNEDGEEDEEEEDFQEARDSPYEDDEELDDNSLRRSRANRESDRDINNRKWRRRIEQAFTKMTAEIAAIREQIETRAVYSRRRTSLWAWLKWLVWVAIRQLCWHFVIIGVILIWMRLKGDRRLEDKLKTMWAESKKRLARIRFLRHAPRFPSLP